MAAGFNNSTDYLGRTSDIMDMNAAYTIMGWIKITASPAAANVIAALNNTAGSLYDLVQHNNGTLILSVDGTGNNGSTITTNTWYHFAMVRSSTTLVTMYLDGVSDATDTQNITSRAANTQENIGGILATYDMNGSMANVKAWSAALSVAEIRQEMNVVRPIRIANLHLWTPLFGGIRTEDWSGNGRTWTENGTITNDMHPPVSFGEESNIIPFAAAAGGFQAAWARNSNQIIGASQ